jgi:acetolactate decarboxylase
MVGFWFPRHMGGLNVPGYHFHFLTDDRTRGGHVLDARPRLVTVTIDETATLSVAIPRDAPFRSADLDRSHREELEKIESGK